MISLKELVKKKEAAVVDSRVLRIDCRVCENEPDYGDGICIRCISGAIAERGEPERIILRSGTETEYTGDAVGIMNQLSSAFVMKGDIGRMKGRCAECKLSPEALNDEMWGSFSIADIDGLITKLDNVLVDCEECAVCVETTMKSFISVRDKLDSISKDALRSAYKIMGV